MNLLKSSVLVILVGICSIGATHGATISNDCDPSRLPDKVIDSALQAEDASQRIVEELRTAIDGHDFKAVHLVFARLVAMSTAQIQSMSPVLRDARRMLNGAFIQEISVTTQIRDLLRELDSIEARLRV